MLFLRWSMFLVVSALAVVSSGQRHRSRTTSSTKTTSSTRTTSTTTSTTKSTSSTKSTSHTTSTSTTTTTSSTSTTSTTTTSTTTPVAASGTVILPLYISPTSSAWNPIYTALSANQNLKFQVIVNPASGPGAANTYPNKDYVAAIPKLRSYANAIPICYVHTSYTQRAITAVLTDIQTCHYWASYTQADIHMSGIFFDEVVAAYTPATLAYMTNITSYTRTLFGPGNDLVVFNPGINVSSQWYSLADYIVAFENSYTAYSGAVITSIAPAQRPQSMFIIYGFSGNTGTQQTFVDGIIAAGIGGLFVTTVAGYEAWSSLWAQFCTAMSIA